MKLLVCGSRKWSDAETIRAWLRRMPAGTIVVHGGAAGADTLAGEVARELGFEVRVYPAEGTRFGRSAGPRRNEQMLAAEQPDRALAFTSMLLGTGTGDMVFRLVLASVVTTVVPPGGRPR